MVRKNLSAVISKATVADHTIISAVTGRKINITSFLFTVGGEVDVTLKNGTTALTGAMDFGATSEPRGIVSNFSESPIELTPGNAFVITLSHAVQVSGLVCYYLS